MPYTLPAKDPSAVLEYGLDWNSYKAPRTRGWLGEDTITASTWTVPDGITKADESHDDTTTTVWLTGGTAGQVYDLVNHITTADGREDERTIRIPVRER